jgi:DNA-binding beta-propeller fold protein YncE
MGRRFLGEAPYLFEVMRHFAHMPSGMELGSISSVACDSMDRVFVFQRGDPPLLIFDSDGRLVDTWGDGTEMDAHGMFIDHSDTVLLVNRAEHHVLEVKPSGESRVLLGDPGHPRFGQPFCDPADIAVSPDGEYFVADGYGNFNVHRFDASGNYVSTWGRAGREAGEFRAPHGIWVNKDRRVLVADRENGRVQIFEVDGTYVSEWPWFFRPTDIFVDDSNHIFVTDLVPSLSVISPAGKLIARGKPVDEFAHSVWGNSKGDLFVVHRRASEIVKLARIRA